MKAILASRRFNPGHISHIEANYRLLSDRHFDVKFLVDDRFSDFSELIREGRKATLIDCCKLVGDDLLIVWFPSFMVLIDTLVARIFSSGTIVFVLHEPYTSFSSYRKAGFSRKKAFKILLISFVNYILCRLSDKIILPSDRAFKAEPRVRCDASRYAKINLLFADEAGDACNDDARLFISYIGNVAEDHAFDDFVRLALQCIERGALQPFKFLIATRSAISDEMAAAMQSAISSDRLVVYSGKPMTNEHINGFYAKSFLVWNAYKRSMQSGVLPKAYMFGAPVLMSTENQSEYFEGGTHGSLISNDCTVDDFSRAVLRVAASWHEMSDNCRKFYLQNFDYKSLSDKFMKFVLGVT